MTDEEQRQLITPVCFAFASAIFVALLVYDAAEVESGHIITSARYTSARNAALGAAIRGLAEMLGLVGSIVASTILLAAMGLWIAMSYRKIKRLRTA